MYLTYEEYRQLGGLITCEVAFNSVALRAEGIINNATMNRLKYMAETPESVKLLEYDLINYLNETRPNTVQITSESQGAGSTSESVSYQVINNDEHNAKIFAMLTDYLLSETDDNGVPLLYRGV